MRVKLRALLNSRGITQAELAQATGIRPSTISQLCNNIAVGFKLIRGRDKDKTVLPEAMSVQVADQIKQGPDR